jgi:hypothetical protein
LLLIKSLGAGLIGAITAVVAWVLVVMVLPAIVRYSFARYRYAGSGGLGFVITSINVLIVMLVAVLGFVLAFWWTFRRG